MQSHIYWNSFGNEDFGLQYVDEVNVPYVNNIRKELPWDRINQNADAILDIFATHRTDCFDFEIEVPQHPAAFCLSCIY